jgi:hypothetical protein
MTAAAAEASRTQNVVTAGFWLVKPTISAVSQPQIASDKNRKH